jgi:hypothetical protein
MVLTFTLMIIRFEKKNLVIVTERRKPGYAFDATDKRFVRKMDSPVVSAGTGYNMMQLAWPGEGFTLNGNTGGTAGDGRCPLAGTVLDFLKERGVTRLITRRLHDLSLYEQEGAIDLDTQAFALFLEEELGSNMMTQVDIITNLRSTVGREG